MTTEQETQIREIAEWMGILRVDLEDYSGLEVRLVDEVRFKFGIHLHAIILGEPIAPHLLILFAAYVKAEMARRGWHTHVLTYDSPCESYLSMFHIESADETQGLQFDPTNPLSEARAIIAAAHEAMQQEGK